MSVSIRHPRLTAGLLASALTAGGLFTAASAASAASPRLKPTTVSYVEEYNGGSEVAGVTVTSTIKYLLYLGSAHVGHAVQVCVVEDSANHCTATYLVVGGSLKAMFSFNHGTTGIAGTGAVDGGTGKFLGATGTITIIHDDPTKTTVNTRFIVTMHLR